MWRRVVTWLNVRDLCANARTTLPCAQVVTQDSLVPLTTLDAPAVIVVAARFGSVRLLDNMELGAV